MLTPNKVENEHAWLIYDSSLISKDQGQTTGLYLKYASKSSHFFFLLAGHPVWEYGYLQFDLAL